MVQEAVLGQWGINLITGSGDDPETALIAFLEELQHRVNDSETERPLTQLDSEASWPETITRGTTNNP